MSRILLTTFGSFGDINPFVGIARGLKARGHDPVVATSEFYRAYIEGEGIGFAPVRPDLDPADRDLLERVMHRRTGSEVLVRTVLQASLRDSYDDIAAAAVGADAMVTHMIPFAGPVVAERLGLPWVSLIVAPMSFFSVHDLPVLPPATWLHRVTGRPAIARFVRNAISASSDRWMRPLYALRREAGLDRGTHPLFGGLNSPQRIIAIFSKVLAARQPDWPGHTEVTGPVMFSGSSWDESSGAVARFLDAGPPPVVFTLGSAAVGVAGSFSEASAEAARRAGVRAILMVGSHPENIPPAVEGDASVLVIAGAPYQSVFPHAAAVVHQGGIGTLHQALASGRPMIIVPHAHDQPDNAARAEGLGVGRVIHPQRYRAKRVERVLRELLADETMQSRASAVGEIVRSEDGVGRACDEIEMMLKS